MCGDRLIIEAIAGNSFSVALCQSLSDEMLHDERMAAAQQRPATRRTAALGRKLKSMGIGPAGFLQDQ
jgi:hypothetical protein